MRLTTSFLMGCLLAEAPMPESSPGPDIMTAPEIEQTVEVQPLPDSVRNRVQTGLSNYLGIPTDQINIARYSHETWFDGCLGLGGPAELCLAALTEGWQVEAIAPTGESYFYRTDLTGNQVRRSTLDNNLPPSLEARILQTVHTDVTEAEGREPALSITQAQTRVWDGCYGLPSETGDCPEIAIMGWRAIVTDGDYHWIYHTDNLGNTILLNEAASTNTVIPNLITGPMSGLSEADTTFQSVSTEGGADKAREVVVLDADGQLSYSQYRLDQPEENEIISLSQQQIDSFFSLLEENNFQSFMGLYYSPTADRIEFDSVALMAPTGMVLYAEASLDDLPGQLQRIIRSWEEMR
ncbi:hypothetical protein D0962_08910 [Leptolyngbyaceae cyanobacterium CCMR0082]|uniref:Uncharacterized protein n=2 Tax=Adonisia TaxID=2950183 RepID=A0A6M0S3K8_9CYAN|nr:hypothetical protein [Adonisia turfae CCMR0082]